MAIEISRRNLIKAAGGLGAASLLGLSNEEIAQAASTKNAVRVANWSLEERYRLRHCGPHRVDGCPLD